jgi:putative intracellular protease/amidase
VAITRFQQKGEHMKALFIITSNDTGAWLSEITHPYWHLTERGVEVDFASPEGGKVVWSALSDPYGEGSQEPEDLVSKGFLSDATLVARLDTTAKLADVDLDQYDVVHVAGGQGATYDLFPNEDVARALEHFWRSEKVVGAICHGAIALGNIPENVRGRRVTGYSLEGDKALEGFFGPGFFIPHYPQKVLEDVGTLYTSVGYTDPCVVVDGRLITGQNQQSASEYAIALLHLMHGDTPVTVS